MIPDKLIIEKLALHFACNASLAFSFYKCWIEVLMYLLLFLFYNR